MNKLSLLGLTVMGSAIVLAGCNKTPPVTESEPETTGQSETEVVSEWQKIGEAIAMGKTAQCDMTNTETGDTSRYYIKGKNIRFDTVNATNPEQSGSFLTDGEFIYTWTEAAKEGVKFSAIMPSGTPNPAVTQPPQAPDFSTEDAWLNYQNLGYTIDCSVEPVDDSLFIPPTDVTFTDMTALMKKFTQVTPVVSGGASQIDEAQIKELMQQFGGSAE